ncbi:MAG: FMN-binding protein [Pseudomonadota bacterium]|nr:FMN-binding protein [Pseudomonadota bacterium]
MLSLFAALACTPSRAEQVYQRPEAFIEQTFGGDPPDPGVLYLKGATKKTVKEMLGHRYRTIRVRYWLKDGRSAWILEEVGKERPITTGFVISDGAIERTRVLVFRESRGWEVRHDFFTDQFIDARLDKRSDLDVHIDNISGATLSVRAVKNLSRIALYLHGVVTSPDA